MAALRSAHLAGRRVPPAAPRTAFLRRKLGNFFINRDGFGCETVVKENLREPFEILKRAESFALADKQIAQGHQCDLVLRFVLEDTLIFRNGLRQFP